MLVGHVAAGLAVKCAEPKLSLGTTVLAAFAADLLLFIFLIAGIENIRVVPGVASNRFMGDIPYSHSLLMGAVWAVLLAGVYFLVRRYRRGAWFLGAAVLSHWVLDVISHRPDMQFAPGVHAAVGLGLWNSPAATWVVEGGLWALALFWYVRATRARNKFGIFFFWAGGTVLTLVWLNNITAGIDPNPARAGWNGLIFFSLIVAWAYWMNRLRPLEKTASSPA